MRAELTKDFAPFVRQAYKADPECVKKWHVIAGSGLNKCIQRTIEDLKACETLQFYVVYDGDRFVGYFGSEFDGTYMPTIFVMPEYRNRKDEFWELVRAIQKPTFKAGIFYKNIPCRRFYEKLGNEVARVKTRDGEGVVYQFKAGTVCL
jgi:hypothetical protein